MSHVTALGYVRMNAPDLDAWRSFATNILGLQVNERVNAVTGDDALYLRQDERSYRIALDPNPQPGTTFGWEVADRAALDAISTQLTDAGVTVEEAADAAARLTEGLVRCQDPAGNTCEFFHGAAVDDQPFESPLGAHFATGDMGLGHAFAIVPDADAFQRFYSSIGFLVSDTIGLMPGITGTFLHCNPRHHTLAYIEVPGVSALQHIMVEVDSMDLVGRSYDACLAGAAPIVMTLGRHTNDQMFSFYANSPNGVAIELGTGGYRIEDEDSWEVRHYDAASHWGHKMQAPAPAPS